MFGQHWNLSLRRMRHILDLGSHGLQPGLLISIGNSSRLIFIEKSQLIIIKELFTQLKYEMNMGCVLSKGLLHTQK